MKREAHVHRQVGVFYMKVILGSELAFFPVSSHIAVADPSFSNYTPYTPEVLSRKRSEDHEAGKCKYSRWKLGCDAASIISGAIIQAMM